MSRLDNLYPEEEYINGFGDEFDEEEFLEEMMERAERRKEQADSKDTPADSKPAFEVIYNTKLEDGEEPLSRVIGHANQKKELLSVIHGNPWRHYCFDLTASAGL